MTDKPMLTSLASLTGEWVQAVEQAAAELIQVEQALLQPHPPETEAEREARLRAEEAAIEDGFDNLPV